MDAKVSVARDGTTGTSPTIAELEQRIRDLLAAQQAAKPDDKPKDKEKDKVDTVPLFWRMFGTAAMLLACALGIVLYLQISKGLEALRSDVTVLREAYIQLVPRSEFSKSHSEVSTGVQTLQAKNATALEIWTTRVGELQRRQERMQRDDKATIEALTREIQQLRERIAVLENRPTTTVTKQPTKKTP